MKRLFIILAAAVVACGGNGISKAARMAAKRAVLLRDR